MMFPSNYVESNQGVSTYFFQTSFASFEQTRQIASLLPLLNMKIIAFPNGLTASFLAIVHNRPAWLRIAKMPDSQFKVPLQIWNFLGQVFIAESQFRTVNSVSLAISLAVIIPLRAMYWSSNRS